MDWKTMMLFFTLVKNNLYNIREDEEYYKVKLIKQEFKRLMFDE